MFLPPFILTVTEINFVNFFMSIPKMKTEANIFPNISNTTAFMEQNIFTDMTKSAMFFTLKNWMRRAKPSAGMNSNTMIKTASVC